MHEELRQVMNADRRQRFGGSGRPLALFCECGDPICHRTIVISPADYDGQRGPILHSDHRPAANVNLCASTRA